jgi:signal transduction histidine kinase
MRSSKALMAIIDDILDLASFDRGDLALAIAEHDVRSTILGAAEGLQDRLSETGIRLEIDVPDMIGEFRFDAKRVRQILFNLMSNAVGFSSTGQIVTVSARRTSNALMLAVRDRGRGIPADILARVFNRFEAHNAGSRHRGAGLGLSIVRALVERHGGTVSITSEPGLGTEVTCSFPAEDRREGSSEAA